MIQGVRDGTAHGTVMARSVPPRAVAAKPLTSIDIERLLVWVYRDQKAHRIIGLGRGLLPVEAALDGIECHEVSGDGCVQVARQAIMGCKVDGGGNFIGSAADLHPDAETTHRVLLDLFEVPWQILVVQHAIADLRPEWTNRLPRCVPALKPSGRPRIKYEPWDVKYRYGSCVVSFDPPLAWIEFINQVYLDWHEALCRLADALHGKLVKHAVMPPAAPQAPWLEA